MAKSRPFSCYLLKETSTPYNSLKEDIEPKKDTNLPEGALIYTITSKNTPWWKDYWKIQASLKHLQAAAIIFLPIGKRWVALTFGHIYHKLKSDSYEYDFGLITTLNAVDPEKIKSTDIFQPENAKRQKIQTPVASTLTFFDIIYDESVLKRLTGKVKKEYEKLFTNITGAESLRITTNYSSEKIISLCEELLEIYKKEIYKDSFPDIQNIRPIKDPTIITLLDEELLEGFKEESTKLMLTIPEIYDDSIFFKIRYIGKGASDERYGDVSIEDYRAYLKEKKIENTQVSIENFHTQYKMKLVNENDIVRKTYDIYNCFLYDCELENASNHKVNGSYYLCDGSWYKVEKDYVKKLSEELEKHFTKTYQLLPPYKPSNNDPSSKREDEYNKNVDKNNELIISLDKENISPKGQTQIEPCDLIAIEENKIHLIHVKISTRSASLSHLFNQGLNSVELLKMEKKSREKLESLLKTKIEKKKTKIEKFKELIDKNEYVVVYGIIDKKKKRNDKDLSLNLPLFSRISLLRAIKSLQLANVDCLIYFIENQDIEQSN